MSIIKSERVLTRIEYLEEGILRQNKIMRKIQILEEDIMNYEECKCAAEKERDAAEDLLQEAEEEVLNVKSKIQNSKHKILTAIGQIANAQIQKSGIIKEASIALYDISEKIDDDLNNNQHLKGNSK